jgi:hypothetical protein
MVAITGAWTFARVAPARATQWEWALSTTIPRLAQHPGRVLVGSIPWLINGSLTTWLALTLLGLGTLELTVGTPTAIIVVLAGHVGGTALSEGLLGARVLTGALPRNALDVLDVGPSYVVVSALAAVVVLPCRALPRAATGLTLGVIAPALLAGAGQADLTGTGHAAALAIGAVAGALPPVRRRVRSPAPLASSASATLAWLQLPIQRWRPASADTPPVPADTCPSSADTRPASADGQPASADGRLPIADDHPPIADDRSPIADDRSPIADDRSPIADGYPPGADGYPAADEGPPVGTDSRRDP